MKRRLFGTLLLSALFFPFSVSLRAESNAKRMNGYTEIAVLLPPFYSLWKDSAFGNDPNRTERAAWILRKSDGNMEFVRWPRSGAWAMELWVGPVPEGIVGQAHTHPSMRGPMPSDADRALSKRMNVPLYTISVHGIWKATPDGKTTKIEGYNWYKKLPLKPSQ